MFFCGLFYCLKKSLNLLFWLKSLLKLYRLYRDIFLFNWKTTKDHVSHGFNLSILLGFSFIVFFCFGGIFQDFFKILNSKDFEFSRLWFSKIYNLENDYDFSRFWIFKIMIFQDYVIQYFDHSGLWLFKNSTRSRQKYATRKKGFFFYKTNKIFYLSNNIHSNSKL